CLFLAGPTVGAIIGWVVAGDVITPDSHAALRVLAGVLLGYLIGGGIVWAMRVFGTLTFGREAMGLGDVHLMAAVGAAIGWLDTTLAFFVAPFFGITAYVVMVALAKVPHSATRMNPYRAYLAGGSVVAIFTREPLLALLGIL